MKLSHFVLSLVIVTAFTACGPSTPQLTMDEQIQTAIAETEAAKPTALTTTDLPATEDASEPTPTNTSTPTTPPITGPITGRVNISFLNLRSGPSTLHNVIGTFDGGTDLIATGRVPTSDWVEVEIDDVIGWMATEFLALNGNVLGLPVIPFPNSLTVTGRVEDTDGNPIGDIAIAVFYRYDDQELRADVSSDAEGKFLVYLPQDLLGALIVQIVDRGCQSPVVDAGCNLSGYIQGEDRTSITIPQQADIVFLYEPATLTLTGKVFDSNGTPMPGIEVSGIRDDRAKTFGITDSTGQFRMPIDSGLWGIYSFSYDPVGESQRVYVTVANTNPNNIEVPAPFGGAVVDIDTDSIPGNVVLAKVVGDKAVLREVKNYNNSGVAVMGIREPRVIYYTGEQVWIYPTIFTTDGGTLYYEVYDADGQFGVKLHIRDIDIEILN